MGQRHQVRDFKEGTNMSPHHRVQLSVCEDSASTDGPSTHDYAMLEELTFVRREAQAEANEAYEDWRCMSSRDSYAVYRAAQDRADAAQDDLADLSSQIAA
jgi:hypothetical protein